MFKKVFLTLFLFIFFTSYSYGGQLLVSAAASTKEMVSEIAKLYEKNTGIKVFTNFSSSGKLAIQIENGAPVDIYVSASKKWIKYLSDKKFLIKSSVKNFASNTLVVIERKNSSVKGSDGLKSAKTIAICDYRFAPAGKYAYQSLKNLGMWNSIKNKIILAPDVRKVVMWTMTGNSDVGIVYYTDYLKFKNSLKKVAILPESSHKSIGYYVATVSDTKNIKEAKEFSEFFIKQKKVFKKYGFKPVKE